jgi:molybdenum cofactor biosynthesis protein B
MGVKEHKARSLRSLSCYVITASDTRTEETDKSGEAIIRMLKDAGHNIAGYSILKDEPADIRRLIRREARRKDLHAFIINGGTGISSRDSTFDAIEGILEKKLPGFGELFRWLSYKEIGTAAIMSRSTAGVFKGKVIVSVPGSLNAVKLAMKKLILPELPHMVAEVSK